MGWGMAWEQREIEKFELERVCRGKNLLIKPLLSDIGGLLMALDRVDPAQVLINWH